MTATPVQTESKYRATVLFSRVREELIRAAEYRGLTTYQHVALIMGLPLEGNHMGREVGQILGEISGHEVADGRPMLSSVVVNTEGHVSQGFFDWARALGRLNAGQEDKAFLERERRATYSAWRRPLTAEERHASGSS